jgi:diadenosine tetraphosphate (Ap4A) HIT family hydrolase
MSKTLFEKIAAREIPAAIVYEDYLVLALRDVKPQAPTHVLIIPKKPIPRIAEATPDDHKVLGHLLLKAAEVAPFALPHHGWPPHVLAPGMRNGLPESLMNGFAQSMEAFRQG